MEKIKTDMDIWVFVSLAQKADLRRYLEKFSLYHKKSAGLSDQVSQTEFPAIMEARREAGAEETIDKKIYWMTQAMKQFFDLQTQRGG